jgi:hypothetical protein
MIHKFAVVVDKTLYNKVYNDDFYLRVMILDIIRVLSDKKESLEKYKDDLFYKCAKSIANEVKMFEDENSVIFYAELSNGYLDDFFEKPLDDLE